MKITLRAINDVLTKVGLVLVVGNVPDGTEPLPKFCECTVPMAEDCRYCTRPLIYFTIQRFSHWVPVQDDRRREGH